MSSSVFLSNVDDYVAPSQACVNPLFSEKTNAVAEPKEDNDDNDGGTTPTVGRVVPRRRRRMRAVGEVRVPQTPQSGDAVKASIADCLACSGCVTTAETVLLEETHSLDLIRARWKSVDPTAAKVEDNNTSHTTLPMVLTLSPAAWADLMRHVTSAKSQNNNNNNNNNTAYRHQQRQWTTLLAETLGATAVLDGNLPLQWSLDAAAQEFCARYQPQRHIPPSTVIAGSCPAVVCLVEKSAHGAVPHLSTTPSAQAWAGAFWKGPDSKNNKCFHVAVMPCHDKKLEASRPALFQTLTSSTAPVDLVLTTQDCLQLMLERLTDDSGGADADSDAALSLLRQRLDEVPLARVVEVTDASQLHWDREVSTVSHPVLFASPAASSANNNHNQQPTDDQESMFVYGSGGYADYIFRYACRYLFQVTDLPDALPWQPVLTTATRRVSARVAAAPRDYYQVALYRRSDGTHVLNCNDQPPQGDADLPVLNFCIAYGMQTLQRILAPLEEKSTTSSPWHYVEAMACPSGCVNGGGQLRLAARERPTQTKERVQQTREVFQRPSNAKSVPLLTPPPPPPEQFRAVPPLELAQGAVKGVAVKDVQW